MQKALIFVTAALAGTNAAASTPQAWKELQRRAERSCIAASDLASPRASNMVVFDDQTGMVAFLISGTHRQSYMKGATGTDLCLYDRRRKKASVEEAKGWKERR
jgi:hypothetical protein